MKTICALAFFLWIGLVQAQIEITPLNNQQAVEAGDVVEARLDILDEGLVNEIKPIHWKSAGDKKSFLFMEVGPLQKDASGWFSEARIVIGAKFNPNDSYPLKLTNKLLDIRFKGWSWVPNAKASQAEYIYEDIPLFSLSWWKRQNKITILIGCVIVGLLVALGLKWQKKRNEKASRQRQLQKWRDELQAAQTLLGLGQIWVKRDDLRAAFPKAHLEIQAFFEELNLIQFKPSFSEEEINKILQAKERLVHVLAGDHHGV